MNNGLKYALVIAALVLAWTSTASAEKESYCYVTAYSYNLKTAYHTLIFKQTSKGKSFNDEQYVADMKQIRKLEDAFQTHLKRKSRINPNFFVFSARTGFKNRTVAEGRLKKELVDLRTKGIRIQVVNDFKAD